MYLYWRQGQLRVKLVSSFYNVNYTPIQYLPWFSNLSKVPKIQIFETQYFERIERHIYRWYIYQSFTISGFFLLYFHSIHFSIHPLNWKLWKKTKQTKKKKWCHQSPHIYTYIIYHHTVEQINFFFFFAILIRWEKICMLEDWGEYKYNIDCLWVCWRCLNWICRIWSTYIFIIFLLNIYMQIEKKMPYFLMKHSFLFFIIFYAYKNSMHEYKFQFYGRILENGFEFVYKTFDFLNEQ